MRQLVQFLDGKTTKTELVNQLEDYASTTDINRVVAALEQLDNRLGESKLDITPLTKGLTALEEQLKQLPTEYPEYEAVEEVTVKNQIDLKPLEKAIKAIQLKAPDVNVAAPEVNVDAPDLKPLQSSLLDVVKAIKGQELPVTDLKGVEKKLDESNKHLKKLVEKPVGGGGGGGNGTPYVDSTGKFMNVELESDGSVPVTVVTGGGGGTTYSKPTDEYDLIQDDDTSSASYEYYGFMKADGGWYIKRITLASNLREYVKGTSSYSTEWTGRASQTYADYGSTF